MFVDKEASSKEAEKTGEKKVEGKESGAADKKEETKSDSRRHSGGGEGFLCVCVISLVLASKLFFIERS